MKPTPGSSGARQANAYHLTTSKVPKLWSPFPACVTQSSCFLCGGVCLVGIIGYNWVLRYHGSQLRRKSTQFVSRSTSSWRLIPPGTPSITVAATDPGSSSKCGRIRADRALAPCVVCTEGTLHAVADRPWPSNFGGSRLGVLSRSRRRRQLAHVPRPPWCASKETASSPIPVLGNNQTPAYFLSPNL